jgi:hypothetical protein
MVWEAHCRTTDTALRVRFGALVGDGKFDIRSREINDLTIPMSSARHWLVARRCNCPKFDVQGAMNRFVSSWSL